MWEIGEMIGDREGRMDVCAAVAGIFSGVNVPAMDKPKELFQKVRFGGLLSHVASWGGWELIQSAHGTHARQVMDVNAGGALFTAQAAGRQMLRFGNGGSIILVASICGSVAMEVRKLIKCVLKPEARAWAVPTHVSLVHG